MTWTAWHDLDDAPYVTGTETEAKEAAKCGADEGDYVEAPDGTQYGWNPVFNDWTEGLDP